MARRQKEKTFITAGCHCGIALVISTFSDSVAITKGDANEFRGHAGAAKALSRMKTWTRRVTRTRDNAQLKKMMANPEIFS